VEGAGVTSGVAIRVRGLVQGVGFRPAVWRLARERSLAGRVRNDGDGVLIEAWGPDAALCDLVSALEAAPPPLARIDAIETAAIDGDPPDGFAIVESAGGAPRTGVVADAATCAACAADVADPLGRRYRYPFTNCTHCGPRFSIVRAIPYDRANTSMAGFAMCAACAAEYTDPGDRRFHAQPNACHRCGPRISLERADGRPFFVDGLTSLDAADACATLLLRGEILAIKGLGGYQLACDASDGEVVARLRERKRREAKPLALMARDLEVIERHVAPGALDAVGRAVLESPAAPIVLLPRAGAAREVAREVAPESAELGFMLPTTPLHALILWRIDRPVVMTSGNHSGAPPCTGDGEARDRLGDIADYFLIHDRPIANRVDDSVVRMIAGRPRPLRRARGYAPAPLCAPPGFEAAPPILAMGGELKSTFCVSQAGAAIVSQHIGDLEDAATLADYDKNLALYRELYDHTPAIVAVDRHPDYLSRQRGLELAASSGAAIAEVGHHHAHIASCLFEHRVPLDAAPVLGIALDGLGHGDDGSLWGGEFLLADYRSAERLATFKPVAMLGGERAMAEPWRNTFAHLDAEYGWPRTVMNFAELELVEFFQAKPVEVLLVMLERPDLAPRASSAGRLFDAVAAAVGICRERADFEGQAAMALEAIADPATLASDAIESAYPFAIPRLDGRGLPYIEPVAMWQALLGDLIEKTPAAVISARFHKGLAGAVAAMVIKLRGEPPRFDTVALSGGVGGVPN
jgi:hydrogenase maturation protein HypF